MSVFNGGYSGPQEVRYLFIDGACLREGIVKIANTYARGAQLTLDYDRLTQGYSKVFYYDALPRREPNEDESTYHARIAPQRHLFDTLSRLDRFHVYEGDVRRSSSRRSEQKKVDVMIAVDMLTHSFRQNMQQATLLTSDLDFKPLIDALIREGMFVSLWYRRGATAKKLIAAADRSWPLNVSEVHAALVDPLSLDIPIVYVQPSKGDYTQVLTKWIVDDREITLMKDGPNFVVAVPTPSRDHAMYYQHSDLAILRTYLVEMCEVSIPDLTE
jgi:uncharacterized LabA/DUF88 family protein